jgi:hypothetical protein
VDERLRALEAAWQRTQSSDDELALLRGRLRAGVLDNGLLEVAAWCGHEGAKSLLSSWRSPPKQERGWANWVAARGARASVVVGYWLVRAALERSEAVLARRVGIEPCLAAHSAIMSWIRDPGSEQLRECLAQERALRASAGRFRAGERFQKRACEALGVLLATPEDPALLENVVYLLLLSGSHGEPKIKRGPDFRQDVSAWALGHAAPRALAWESVPQPAAPAIPELPPWDQLAESERWFRVVGLSRKWSQGPLSPSDGLAPRDLVQVQEALDEPLSRSLAEWLLLAGRRYPLTYWVGLTPGIAVRITADQERRAWIRSQDLSLVDPPVYSDEGSGEELRVAESFSEFVLLEVLSEILSPSELDEDSLLGPLAEHVRRGVAKGAAARAIREQLAPLFPGVTPEDSAAEEKLALLGDADTVAATRGRTLRLALRAGRRFSGVVFSEES